MTARAKQALLAYEWPGNVRELENEARRLAVLSSGVIDSADLRFGSREPSTSILASGVVRRE